jgi:hypothetical protein
MNVEKSIMTEGKALCLSEVRQQGQSQLNELSAEAGNPAGSLRRLSRENEHWSVKHFPILKCFRDLILTR